MKAEKGAARIIKNKEASNEAPSSNSITDNHFDRYSRRRVFVFAILFKAGTRSDTENGFTYDAASNRPIYDGQAASAPIPERLGEWALFEADSNRPRSREKRTGYQSSATAGSAPSIRSLELPTFIRLRVK